MRRQESLGPSRAAPWPLKEAIPGNRRARSRRWASPGPSRPRPSKVSAAAGVPRRGRGRNGSAAVRSQRDPTARTAACVQLGLGPRTLESESAPASRALGGRCREVECGCRGVPKPALSNNNKMLLFAPFVGCRALEPRAQAVLLPKSKTPRRRGGEGRKVRHSPLLHGTRGIVPRRHPASRLGVE